MKSQNNLKRLFSFMKPGMRRILLYCFISICGFLFLIFILRNPIFNLYLHHKTISFSKTHHASLVIGKAEITGISSILLKDIVLKPDTGDTLVRIGMIQARLDPWRLIFGRISLRGLEMKNTVISLVRRNGKSNWRILVSGKHQNIEEKGERNYAERASDLASICFSFFPNSMDIENFIVSGNDNGHQVTFIMKRLKIENHAFISLVTVSEDTASATWMLKGRLDPSEHVAGFTLFPGEKKKISVPYLTFKWNADIRFDSADFNISEKKPEPGLSRIEGVASISGLLINQEKISALPVSFEKLGINYLINIKKDRAELDSTTTITFNRLDFHPFVSFRPRPSKQFIIRIHKRNFPAQDLFSSLPEGLFSNLAGIKVKGELSWNLDLSVDLANPDSLILNAGLERNKFTVLSFGNCDLSKINEPFLYTAYEKGILVKTFSVGPENPDYRPLEKISPYLKLAVLGSEDAGFYQHRGFLPDATRESLITDIKERKFARGGSTISMQLIKNVFLNRNKTLSRKLEEALLVWLIENQGISTKDRMFEVYLNIIEWGPGIYGAGEASRFYFNKDVSKLSLAESIFLASIIPKPKWFMYSFDKSGQPGQSTVEFLKLLSAKMLRKEQITQQEYDKFVPEVELKGAAKFLLKRSDSIPRDSIPEEDL